jgi:hypothetical protein
MRRLAVREAQSITAHPTLAARYLAISGPANARLDHDVDRFDDDRTRDLASAAAGLARVNEARTALDLRAAAATSRAAVATFGPAQSAADAGVEEQARIVRAELGLPPPETS